MESPASEIKIVPLGDVDHGLLEYLVLTLSASFSAQCVEFRTRLNFQDAYNATRRQYHSTPILTMLKDLEVTGSTRILGVTEVDLFIPIFTFVFGEAQVEGTAALMSTHRLHQHFYGLPEDRNLFFARAEKEAVHELGHAFGLVHCRRFDCVMRFSNSVEEVDLKASNFCQLCEARLPVQPGSPLAA